MELGYGNTVAGTPINDGQWHHVACVLDELPAPVSTDVKFYVDGQLDSVVGGAPVAIDTLAHNDVLIGCDIQNRFFNGTIDEVRIFNRALSAAELDALYHGTNETAAAWHRRYFGNAPIDWNADDDADGVSRLGEYAFGGQPWITDADAMKIVPEISGNHLQVRFNRRISGISELIYELQQSSDLVHWTALAGTEISADSLDAISGMERVTFRADSTVSNQASSFIRILVRLP